MIKLTNMEKQFLNAMRNNDFGDILEEGAQWLFSIVDECDFTEKQSTGVVSSLVKKDLICTEYLKDEREYVVDFTKNGKKLFETANGEPCNWGGKNLLEI